MPGNLKQLSTPVVLQNYTTLYTTFHNDRKMRKNVHNIIWNWLCNWLLTLWTYNIFKSHQIFCCENFTWQKAMFHPRLHVEKFHDKESIGIVGIPFCKKMDKLLGSEDDIIMIISWNGLNWDWLCSMSFLSNHHDEAFRR